MRRFIVTVTILAVACAFSLTSALAGTPPEIEPVVPGPGQQLSPTASKDGLAWTDLGNGKSTVYYKQFGGRQIQVNKRGWSGATGSLTDPHTLVYQQFRLGRHYESDIFTFNTKTHRRHAIRPLVNSAEWEYNPVASQRAILFNRCYLDHSNNCKRTALMLYDSSRGGKVRTLIRDFRSRSVVPGFAGDRYVAWTDCAKVRCHIGYYDMREHKVHLMGVRNKDIFAPWVDEDAGQMYYSQDGAIKCGDHTTIRIAPLGQTDGTLVSKLRPTWALAARMALATNAGGGTDLYVTRAQCVGHSSASIYRVNDVITSP